MSDEDLTQSEIARREDVHVHPSILRTLYTILHDIRFDGVLEAERLVDRERAARQAERPRPAENDFGARALALIPSLVRTAFELRRVLVDQIARRISACAESQRDKEALLRHRDEIASAASAAGATGPADEFELIMYLYQTQIFYEIARLMNKTDRVLPWAPEFTSKPAVDFLKRWMAGHSIRSEIDEAVDEGARFQRQWLAEAEQNRAKHAEDVAEFRRLLEELRVGRIPPELETVKRKGKGGR